MNDTENRVVCCSQLADSNTSCVPAFASRFSQPIHNEVDKPCSVSDGGNAQGKREKIFPWLTSFSKQCCAAVGNKSVKQLENLLNTYIQHVTPHYNECQKLPNKAFKVKRNINETMVFLHLLYSDLHEPLENSFYHEKMAEVMAMYLDLEITASRRGKDTVKEVYNRLSCTLYTLLDHSDDHILDALLKTQLVNKHSKHLCGPFLRKVLTELVVRRPLSALTYVRYVLAFKLWKTVVAEANEKKAINKIALQRLDPPPKFFQDHDIAKPSAEILPKVPKNKKNSSQFYLQTKFNLKDACRAFFRFCKETNCQEEPVYIPTFSEKTEDVDNNGCLSLINDIWSTISNDVSDNMPLLGKSEVFSEDRMFCDDTSFCESGEVFIIAEVSTKNCKKVESPDSGVCLDNMTKTERKKSTDGERDKVPDSTYVMFPDSQELKCGGDESVTETISEAASPEPSSTVSVPALDENQQSSETSSSFHLLLSEVATGKFVEAAVRSRTSETDASVSEESPSSKESQPINSLREEDYANVKIKSERFEEVELPSSSRYHTSSNNVCVEEKPNALSYQEVFPRNDLAKLEWRHYSELEAPKYLKTHLDVSLEEQIGTDEADGSRNHHSSGNCHLPLKKRKLAANSNSSPNLEPKQGYSSPYHSVSDLEGSKLFEDVVSREEKREFVVDGNNYVHWDTMQESRFQLVEYVQSDTRYCPKPAIGPEENTPADLSTNAPFRSSSERIAFAQRGRSFEEVYSVREPYSSSSSQVGVHKIVNIGQSSQHVGAEVPDNLKILAEEAARIWEEREQGTNVQTPYGIYTSHSGALDMKASYIPTYASGRIMSLAEVLGRPRRTQRDRHDQPVRAAGAPQHYQVGKATLPAERVSLTDAPRAKEEGKGTMLCEDSKDSLPPLRGTHKKVKESVIVRNDQYQYYKEQPLNGGRVYSNTTTQFHDSKHQISVERDSRYHRMNGDTPRGADLANESSLIPKDVVAKGGDHREHKPIDMSGKTKDVLPYSRNACDKGRAIMSEKSSFCSNCKLPDCKGTCEVFESIDKGASNRPPDTVSGCRCKSQVCNGKRCRVVSRSRELSAHHGGSKTSDTPSESPSEIPKKYKKCSYCKNSCCDGTCKIENNVNAYRPSSSSKSVCQYCKKTDCDSQCWYASPEGGKKCNSCQSPSCKGKCKANINSTNKKNQMQEMQSSSATAKFAKCHYCKSTCFGTCRLAEKNQNQLLGNVRCNLCNTVSCKGKCSTGAACGHCSQKSCSGTCRIHHSVDSILGPSTGNSALNDTGSRSNRRRTRNSKVQPSKSQATVREEKSTPETKRRKKSVSR